VTLPVGKIAEFDNMTLYFECRINKNAQSVFLAILPTGLYITLAFSAENDENDLFR